MIKDNIIDLKGYDEETCREIYNKMRIALLDNKIPHFRPIGVYVGAHSTVSHDKYMFKIKELGYSILELDNILRNLIYFESGGFMSLQQAIDDEQQQTMLYLTIKESTNKKIYSDSDDIIITGENTLPKPLVKDKYLYSSMKGRVAVSVICAIGTGVLDYSDTRVLLNQHKTYKPLRAIYSLSECVALKNYIPNSKRLEFYYKDKVDEGVLDAIIENYMKSEVLPNVKI